MTNNKAWEEDSIKVNDADGNLKFEVIDLVKPDKLVPTYVKGAEYSDWRKELEENWTNITTGNKVGQTFRHVSGTVFNTGGAIGGVETVPSTTTVYGDTVAAPDITQHNLQGYAKPMGSEILRKKKKDDTNKKLNASEKVAKKANADVMMKARVKEFYDKVGHIQLRNDQVREDNVNKIKDHIKSLKLNVSYDELVKKGAISIEGGAIGIEDDGNGNIKIGVFKGPDVYTKGRNVHYDGDEYSSEIEEFNTEEGVKEIPTMSDELQKWFDAQNVGNKLQSKIEQFARQTFNQIKADLNPFRPIDTITKPARIWASKQISKILMASAKGYKSGSMETPAAVMLAYNDFALNKATGEGSTTSNRLELNNLVSQSDNALIKNKLSGMTMALSKYQQDPVKFKGLLQSAAQTTFNSVVSSNPQFRATFGGAAGSFPQVTIVGNNLVFEKSYGFQHGGSAENIPIQTRLAMDVLGFPPDTAGGSPLSPAPFAARIGLHGDDIHARYYNTMTREERGGKQTSVVHSLYNVPDMHYKYTVPISELIKPKFDSGKSSISKKTSKRDALSLNTPIVRNKKKSNWRSELNGN